MYRLRAHVLTTSAYIDFPYIACPNLIGQFLCHQEHQNIVLLRVPPSGGGGYLAGSKLLVGSPYPPSRRALERSFQSLTWR
jgi:hypothetical protein